MPVLERSKPFVPAPAGSWQAVCVDVSEPFIPKNPINPDREVYRITFALEVGKEDGTPHCASMICTKSDHEKSKLYATIRAMLGAVPDGPVELDVLIGRNAMVDVEQTQRGEKFYSNIKEVHPIPRSAELLTVPDTYVREKDREQDFGR